MILLLCASCELCVWSVCLSSCSWLAWVTSVPVCVCTVRRSSIVVLAPTGACTPDIIIPHARHDMVDTSVSPERCPINRREAVATARADTARTRGRCCVAGAVRA